MERRHPDGNERESVQTALIEFNSHIEQIITPLSATFAVKMTALHL